MERSFETEISLVSFVCVGIAVVEAAGARSGLEGGPEVWMTAKRHGGAQK